MPGKGRTLTIASAISVGAGLSGLLLSAVMGQVKVYFILIIPVFVMEGFLPVISVFLLIAGGIGIFVSRMSSYASSSDISKTHGNLEGGGIIFLGPIPIIFGSRRFREGLPGKIWLWITGFAIFIIVLISIVLISVFS